jgi:hypothetical protein
VASRTRSDFRRWIPCPTPSLALRVRLRGRHCCLGFAASAQLPVTRSPAKLLARSSHLAGYSPERLGHVPSINFCNCVDYPARPRAAKTPPFDRGGEPPRGRWCRSCEASPAELLQPRGPSPHRGGSRRPVRRPYRRSRFTPTCRTSNTPRCLPAPTPVRKERRLATTRKPDARRRQAWPLPAPWTCLGAVVRELARQARNGKTVRAL